MADAKDKTDAAPHPASERRLYEAIFLISQGVAAELDGLIRHIETIFDRAGAEVVAMKKWDERRLAYEIEGQKRGIYILAYLHAGPDAVATIEHDSNISEQIMRFMVVRADHMTLDEAAAHDDREGLASEAKMRGQRGDDKQTRGSGVKLGAPEPAQAQAEEPTKETAEQTGEQAAEQATATEPEPGRPTAPQDQPAAETNA
jgi:small subunit ribosomal protein S6